MTLDARHESYAEQIATLGARYHHSRVCETLSEVIRLAQSITDGLSNVIPLHGETETDPQPPEAA